MRIPQKLNDLAPYDPTEGMPRVKLDANESFITLPDEIMNKAIKAVEQVLLNRYPDPGTQNLRKVAAEYFGIKPEQIVAGNGSDELISIIVNSFLEKGSKIIVTKPDFSMYAFYAEMAEVEVVSVEKEDRKINVSELIDAAKENNASAVFFSNPCNPTGTGITREQVISIAKALPEVLVVADEAYMDFWNQSVIDDIDELDNLIVLRTCSKAFGLAGVRLGFAIAKKEIIDLIIKAKSPFNINSITQAVVTVVLQEKEFLKKAIDDIINSRESLQLKLENLAEKMPDKLKVLPSTANFVLVESKYTDIVFDELSKRDIKIRKFPGVMRITAGNTAENEELVKEISKILQNC